MYKKNIAKITLGLCIGLNFIACSNTDLEEQTLPLLGKVTVEGFALDISVQVKEDGTLLQEAGSSENTEFTEDVILNFEFTHTNQPKIIELLSYQDDKQTSLKNYSIDPPEEAQTELGENAFSTFDKITFFLTPDMLLDDVFQHSPGVLTNPDNVGYKFMFPTINRISKSGYEGTLDAIITSFRGQELGVVENINTETFSNFIELPYGAPPFIYIELVKHGTTESYISGETIKIRKIIKKNTSGLIVLNEVANDDGSFKEVSTSIDLTTYFNY